MSDHTTPHDVPRPGVVEELARDDLERKRFLTMAGRRIGGGAAAASLAAFAAAGTSDLDILNFALTLEYLETDFYMAKGRQVGLSGAARTLTTQFGDEEAEHVSALTKAIRSAGGTPAKKPAFAGPVNDQAGFLKLAYVLENTGVGAYNGAGPALTNKQLLAAAGSIVQVEARHAAAIAVLIGAPVTPDGAFDKPLTKTQVLAKTGPLIKA